eukprot:scaffold56439_cov47-Phaeocystis_antarctica.AAC.1
MIRHTPCAPVFSTVSAGTSRLARAPMSGAETLIGVGVATTPQGSSEPRDTAGEAAVIRGSSPALELGEGGHRDGERLHGAERRAVVERCSRVAVRVRVGVGVRG